MDDVLKHGRRFYDWRHEPFMPVELSVAAYRFGHSQVRPSYRAHFSGKGGLEPFFGFIFGEGGSAGDPDDLRGGARAARRFIEWPTFFDFGDGEVRPNKKIDTVLSTPLFKLPADHGAAPPSLAERNLLRHLTFSFPSGERVAHAMKADPLSGGELDDLKAHGLGLENSTPLWFYLLREAERRANGERLGPVGGRIVAEVFVGLLEGDRASYLSQAPDWRPTLPTLDGDRAGKDFRMADLLHCAGVA